MRLRTVLIMAAVLGIGLWAGTSLPPADGFVVFELRLPRAVLAAVAGAAFGLGGALIQSVARNPLASPDVIGITQGAGLAATVALTTGAFAVAPAALAGGLLAAALVFALGSKRGLAANRFILAGVAIAFALRAGIEVVLTSAEVIDAQRAQIWLIGSLNGRGYTEAWPIAAVVILALPVLLWAGWALRTTSLDDDVARGIGVRPVARRYGLAAVGVLLAAAATAQVGAVDFVALVAPQISRRLARSERPPLLASALAGAALVVLADYAGRWILAPTQLPAGVLTAAIGAPYLVYLLLRTRPGAGSGRRSGRPSGRSSGRLSDKLPFGGRSSGRLPGKLPFSGPASGRLPGKLPFGGRSSGRLPGKRPGLEGRRT